jgi:hypothetical protein
MIKKSLLNKTLKLISNPKFKLMYKNLHVESKSMACKLLFAVISLSFLNLHITLGQIKEDTYYISASASSSGNGTSLEKAYLQVSSLNGLHDTTLWMQWNSATFNFNPRSSEGGTFAENLGAFIFYDDYYYNDPMGTQSTLYSTIPTVVEYNKGQYLYTGYVSNEYGTHVSSFQLNVDDPVYLTRLIYSGDISENNDFEVSKYYKNNNNPEFQYNINDGESRWTPITSVSLPPTGGYISVNLLSLVPDASYLYTKDFSFRAVKTLSDYNQTKTYGNILGPFRFYDIPTISIPTTSSPVNCVDKSITFTGGYVHFPTANPEASIEVKLSSDPDDTHWRSVPGVLTNTGLTLRYEDIAAGNNWQGQEIQVRATKMFNEIQKITSDPIRILFLPVANLSFSHSNIRCSGDHNATITLVCDTIPKTGAVNPATGLPVPLIITIKQFGNQRWAKDVTYDSVEYSKHSGRYFYYADGRTIFATLPPLTGSNSISLTESSFGPNFHIGAGIYTISAHFNVTQANCPKSDTFEIKEPPPTNFSSQAVKLGTTTYSIKTGQNLGTVRFNFSGGTPPYYYKLNSSATATTVNDNGQGGIDSYGRHIGIGKDSTQAGVGQTLYNLYDANNCYLRPIDTVNLLRPPDITITELSSDNVYCNLYDGGDHGNGGVAVKLSGGVAPYTAQIFHSSDLVTALPIAPIIKVDTFEFSGSQIKKDSYIIKVSDALNTTYNKPSSAIPVAEPDVLNPLSIPTDPTCSDGNDGSFALTSTGGSGGYQYTLTNGSQTFNNYISGTKSLPIGNYTITVSDAKNCTHTVSDVLSRIPLSLALTCVKPASCTSVRNGKVKAVVSHYRNSTGDITFWDAFGQKLDSVYYASGDTFYISALKTNPAMTIVVKDAYCSGQAVVNIPTRSPGLGISAVTSIKAPCAGKPGTLTVTATNGEQPQGTNYQFSIDENMPQPQSTVNMDYVLDGNVPHSFTITDGMGCSATAYNISVDVISNYLRLNQNPEITSGYCKMSNNGQITVHKITGTGVGNIDFNLTETGAIISDTALAFFPALYPQPYKIVATDTKGCKDSVSLVLGVSPDSLALFLSTQPAACNGGSHTGELKANRYVAGKKTGFGGVTFTYGSPIKADSVIYTGLISGPYTIIAHDSVGCVASATSTVGYLSNPVSISVLSQTDQTCNEVQNAKITLQASSTTSNPVFRFVWGKDTSEVAGDKKTYDVQTAGIYRFSVLDQTNCGNNLTDTIHNLLHSPKPKLDLSSPVACSTATNGSLTVYNSPNNSVPTYRYTLGSATLYASSPADRVSFQDLHKGIYTIYARDTLGCTDTAKFAVNVIPDTVHIVSIDTTSASCIRAQNGKASVLVASGVTGNTYTLVCNGVYLIGDAVTFTNLPVNQNSSYTIAVTDRYGCKNSDRFAIGIIQHPLKLDAGTLVNPDCPGIADGKITLNRNFGDPVYKYQIQPSSGPGIAKTIYDNNQTVTIAGLPWGSYHISVTDTVNCMAELDNITLVEPEPISFYSTYNNYIKRKGDATGIMSAIVWKGNKKYNYEWYSGNILLDHGSTPDTIKIISRLAGNYLLRVQDTAFCGWLERTYTLAEPAQDLSISIVRNRRVSCNNLSDGEFEVKGSGGWGSFYTYGLDAQHIDQSATFSNQKAGTVTVFAKDSAGVVASLPVVIDQPDPLTATYVTKHDATCFNTPNGSVELSVLGGNTPYYAVSADNSTFFSGVTVKNLLSGDYNTYYVRDTLGCNTTVNYPVTINQPTEMVITDTTITKTRCSNAEGSIIATVAGGKPGYSYAWTTEKDSALQWITNEADNLYSGTYHLYVTDVLKCVKAFNFDVWDITDLNIDSVSTKSVSCYGYSDGKATVYISKGTQPYYIQWYLPNGSNPLNGSNGSNPLSGYSSRMYDVKVTDDKNCKTHRLFTIGTPDSIGLESVTRSNPKCEGYSDGSLQILANGSFGGYNYLWDNGDRTTSRTGLLPGYYVVTVTDSHSCFNHFTFGLQYEQTIYPELGKDFSLCKGNSGLLSPGVYDSYQWFSNGINVSHNPQIVVSEAGTYAVSVKDRAGCIGHDTITIGASATLETGKLLIATTVEQHDTVMVFQESWPMPDSVKFDLHGCTILSGDKFYREVIFADTGTFTIGLTAYLNDCRDALEKQVKVEPKSNGTLKSMPSRLIQSFILSPNPNNGQFKAEIHLRENASILMKIANISNGVTMDVREFKGSDIYTLNYNLNLPSGTYLMYLQAGKEAKTKTFVIQK